MKNKSKRLMLACIVLLCLFALNTCRKIEARIDNAIKAIDRSLKVLEETSDQWIVTLEETRDLLIGAEQSILANEVNNLIASITADAGVEFRCDIDFLRSRTRIILENIKAALLSGSESISVPPSLCRWIPQAIDLHLEPERRTKLELFGYDFYQVDGNGEKMKMFLVRTDPSVPEFHRYSPFTRLLSSDMLKIRSALGDIVLGIQNRPLPHETWQDVTDQLFITTGYTCVVDISGSGIPVEDENADRVVLTWGDKILSTIPILRKRPPEVRQVNVTPQKYFEWKPDHKGGDPDFDGKCNIIAKARVETPPTDPRKVILRLYMQAWEPEHDWTEAEGWSSAKDTSLLIYTAPEGFKIQEIASPKPPEDQFEFPDRDHEEDVFFIASMPDFIHDRAMQMAMVARMQYEYAYDYYSNLYKYTDNGLVMEWKFVGDTKGAEAGSQTKVSVFLHNIIVRIVEE